MKLFSRFLLGAVLVLLAGITARAQNAAISPTSLSASPTSTTPGNPVTFTIGAANSNATDNFAGTISFSIILTHRTTGYRFAVSSGGYVSPVGGVIGHATVNPQTGQITPGTGSFVFSTIIPTRFTQAGDYDAVVTMTDILAGSGTIQSASLPVSGVLTVTGKPDFQITSLSYPAGSAYVGGDVIPMTLTFRNNVSTNGTANVPYVPGVTGFPQFFRIQVVLSSNPTFGDSDDFVLVFFDIGASALSQMNGNNGLSYLDADGADRTFSWNQLLPGNLTGSYYVLAKINMLPTASAVSENDPAVQTINGNNVWAGNAMNPNATLINLLPSNFPATSLVSHANAATNTANNYSDNPSMTADGRYVAFASDATNLVASDTNNARDVFIFDSQTSVTRMLSRSMQGVAGNGASNNPVLSSATGRYAAFASEATNLVFNDTNGFSDIFAVDTISGAISRISTTSSGDQANNPSFKPAISQDGRYILFESTATNLIPGVVRGFLINNGGAGYVTAPTVVISGGGATVNATATANISGGAVTSITLTSGGSGYTSVPTVSFTGGGATTAATAQAYITPAVTVIPGGSHIYLHNRDVAGTGTFDTIGNTETVLVDVTAAGIPGNGSSVQPTINADGSRIAFASTANNLLATTPGREHIFVVPVTHAVGGANAGATVLGTMVLASVTNGANIEGNGNSQTPSLSADGRYVAFASVASNLVAGDTNGVSDIFVYDLSQPVATPVVVRVSQPDPSTTLGQATDPMDPGFKLGSINPTISADGRFVAFASLTDNLTAGTPGNYISGGVGATAVATLTGGAVTSITPVTAGSGYTRAAPVVRVRPIGSGATAIALVKGDGTLSSISVSNGGSGFTVAPRVIISGGGATVAATATATISGGVLTGITLNTVGVGYTSQPTVTITSGDNAQASALMRVTGVHITSGGTGYTSVPQVDITGGGGTGATATAVISGGAVSGITITSAGSGYTSAPSVAITGGGGTGAAAIVSMSVNSITVTNGGSNYVTPPAVDIEAGGDANYSLDVFVHDRNTGGVTATLDVDVATTMVSVNRWGYQTGALLGIPSTAASNIYPVISADGRYVAFPSDAENTAGLAFGANNGAVLDSNGFRDVFIHDRRITAQNSGGGNNPTAIITAPGQGGSVLVNTATTLTASAVAKVGVVASVQFYINGVAQGSPVTAFPYTTTWTPTAVGSYTISAIVTDSFGNQGISEAVTVNVNAAPSVSVTAPTSGTIVMAGTAQTITASAAATTPGATIASVEFFSNNQSIGTVTLPPYQVSWTPASPGDYALTAVATDSKGTKSTSAVVTVSANQLPTVSIASPVAPLSIGVNTTQTIVAVATPAGFITSVEFFANGASLGTATTAPYSATWTPVVAGTYNLTAVVTNRLGSTATSAAVPVTVNATAPTGAPTVSITGPAGPININSSQRITADAQVAVGSTGSITSVQFFVNGTSIATSTTYPFSAAWTPTTPGIYVLVAKATDSAGSTQTSAPYNITVNPVSGTAPTVAVSLPASGSTLPVNTAQTVTATATSTGGAITKVDFFANGVAIGSATTYPFSVQWTPLVPGTYALTAVATDSNTLQATSAANTVTVTAGTAPSITISSPVMGSSVTTGTAQTIIADVVPGSGSVVSVQFFANGVSLGTDTSFPYNQPWTPTNTGPAALTAVATDSLGNKTTSAVVSVTVTGASPGAPTVSITSPTAGASMNVGVSTTVMASASDADGTVASVQFFANGVSLGTDTTYPFSAVFAPTVPGIYVLTAQATDNGGNIKISAPISVSVVGGSAPSVAITDPINGTTVAVNMPQTITASASSSGSSVASVQFFVSGVSIGTDTTYPYTTTWTPAALGTYTLMARATDAVGNITDSAPIVVTAGSSASPTVSVTNPVNGANYGTGTTLTLTASAADPDGTITQVQFYVNGVATGGADATSPYTLSWTPGSVGNYTITAQATDNTGNQTMSAPVTVTIGGNQPPTVTLASPSNGAIVNAGTAVTLTANTTDVDGTVTQVRFFANGTVIATVSTAPFSTKWTPTAGGTYSITAEATDNSGNVTTSSAATLTVVGNRLPTVSITTPGMGSTVRITTGATLNATASDPDGTIASVQFAANGVPIGSALVSAPYRVQWAPTSEGVYQLTAVAVDNSGGSTTSAAVTVLAVSDANADKVYSGPFTGIGDNGRFAVFASATGATFIGYSTVAPAKVYYFAGMALGADGSFTGTDSTGRTVRGSTNDTGVVVTLKSSATAIDSTLLIGTVATAVTTSLPAGRYSGSLVGNAGSAIDAILAADGSVMVYVSNGSSVDAAAGTLTSAGATGEPLTSVISGSKVSLSVDPASGLATGTITGTNAGTIAAALASGSSFSDGSLRNLSTRGYVGTGDSILIAGFIVTGDTPKRVLIRGIGPALTDYGVTGVLNNPVLQLWSGSTLTGANIGWNNDAAIRTASGQVGAFPLKAGSLDAAIVTTLNPGAYTATLSGVGGATGVALVELYDVDNVLPFSTQKVVNVSSRGFVGTGQQQLIAGFVVSGNIAKKVLVRAVGPGLAKDMPNGTLADPVLRVSRTVSGTDVVVRENDNWEQGNDRALINAASKKVGTRLFDAGSKDAAVLISLPPGAYTAQVTGANGTTGIALVEVFEIP